MSKTSFKKQSFNLYKENNEQLNDLIFEKKFLEKISKIYNSSMSFICRKHFFLLIKLFNFKISKAFFFAISVTFSRFCWVYILFQQPKNK